MIIDDNELKKSRDVQAMPPTGATTGIGTLLAESRLEVVSVHYTGSTTVETTDTSSILVCTYGEWKFSQENVLA